MKALSNSEYEERASNGVIVQRSMTNEVCMIRRVTGGPFNFFVKELRIDLEICKFGSKCVRGVANRVKGMEIILTLVDW